MITGPKERDHCWELLQALVSNDQQVETKEPYVLTLSNKTTITLAIPTYANNGAQTG